MRGSIPTGRVGVAALEIVEVAVDLIEALLVDLGETPLEPVLDLAERLGPEDKAAGDGGWRRQFRGESRPALPRS